MGSTLYRAKRVPRGVLDLDTSGSRKRLPSSPIGSAKVFQQNTKLRCVPTKGFFS
jgi:hypothetical protein